jgi:hypothetical protein
LSFKDNLGVSLNKFVSIILIKVKKRLFIFIVVIMSYRSMTTANYHFDESEFIRRFISDYYTETDFDLENSFNEYFMNFMQSNSEDYNNHVFIELFIAEHTSRKKIKIDFDNFLYQKLYSIIKTAMKVKKAK